MTFPAMRMVDSTIRPWVRNWRWAWDKAEVPRTRIAMMRPIR